MTRLILHIGYPKTGTTTLQDGLFVDLHFQGLIHYLGRAMYNRPERFSKGGISRTALMSDSLYLNRDLNKAGLIFKPGKLNVLSEETLVYSKEYREIILKKECTSPFTFPERIRDFLEDKIDDILILLTLRNPTSLIYSFYVEHYRFFANDTTKDSLQKSLFDDKEKLKKPILSTCYFCELLDKYAVCFGKDKIRILLFEDLQNDLEIFSHELASLLDIDKDRVKRVFEKVHYRKKVNSDSGYETEIINKTVAGKLFDNIRNTPFLRKPLNLVELRIKNYIPITMKKVFYPRKKVSIPKLSEEEREKIFNEFKPHNQRLSTDYGIEIEKLKKYNYV